MTVETAPNVPGEPAGRRRLSTRIAVVAAVAVAVLAVTGVTLGAVALGRSTTSSSATGSSASGSSAGYGAAAQRSFMFQVIGYKTANQGGQTMNMFFLYRYNRGIATKDIPSFVDLRTQALTFLDKVDVQSNPYWETLGLQLCTQLKNGFPVEAISCELQIYPDDRPGLPYEPGYHTSITTLGDITPLAIPGPSTS